MRIILPIVLFLLISSCTSNHQKPNIILIMADDMGYECLGINGARDYKTPTLDRLSTTGIRFTNAYSQPLCTPSRVKIMTGKYNYRNYEHFGYLNPNQKTIGNLMQEAGYRTCISGKWQLNGLNRNNPGNDDLNRPHHFGFEEYCLWQLHKRKADGERYANPLIYKNGVKMDSLSQAYGPDVFSDFVCEFMEKHAGEPFFIYYPMALVHDPFVPTPASKQWEQAEKRYDQDTMYFREMMAYTDKIVSKIEKKLNELGLEENTILIFTGDNGTNVNITTNTTDGPYPGGKGTTTQRGMHVPFLVSWPGHLPKSGDYSGLMDFSDLYPTLADIADIEINDEPIDGQSFFHVLKGDFSIGKKAILMHYDPMWGGRTRNRFVFNETYKLYRDGKFYNHRLDIDEKYPITDPSAEEQTIIGEFKTMLDRAEVESPWVERAMESE